MPDGAPRVDGESLERLYGKLWLTRRFEEVVAEIYPTDKIKSPVHLSIGQESVAPFRFERMGFAPTTCPTTPALEKEFYPNPTKIAAAAYRLVRPGDEGWSPDPRRAELSYQVQFRGPF